MSTPTQNELDAAANELEQLYRNAPVGLCLMDRQLRFVRLNERLAKFHGLAVEEHIGRTLREVAPDVADIMEPTSRAVLDTGEAVMDKELRIRCEGATPFVYSVSLLPVVIEGQVAGFNAVVQDVTRRKQAEDELQHQAALLDQVHDAVVATDMDGNVRSWNASAERIYGYTAEEAIGRPVSMLYFPEHRPKIAEHVLQPLMDKGSHELLVRNRTKEGEEIFVELRLSLLRDGQQRAIGMVGCSNDVTDKRKLQEQVLKTATREQMRIGQELHDGPAQELTGMSYLARSLARSLSGRSPADEGSVTRIEEGIRRALGQIRDLSKGLIPVEIDADGLMAALADLANRLSGVDGTVCTFVCRESIQVRDNEMATQLYRIAQEASTNAIKHGQATRIQLSLERDGNRLRLRVADDGIGLHVRRTQNGVGLKIMACRAELIGATLNVEPTSGGGTLVSCSFAGSPP